MARPGLTQFDDTIAPLSLNPELTVEEAIVRVREYRLFVALVRSNVEKVLAAGQDPPITIEFLNKQNARLFKRYDSLFRRTG